MTGLKLLLKEKYGLVHVPYDRKVTRWIELTRSHMKTGQSAENAGLLAARLTFPYELRENRAYSGPSVAELLELPAGELGGK